MTAKKAEIIYKEQVDATFNIDLTDLIVQHYSAIRSLENLSNYYLKPVNLTLMEWLFLRIVFNGPDSGLPMSKIAEILTVSQPQVTAIINKLLPQKLVKQKISRQDRRVKTVVLTARGERLFNFVNSQIQDEMNRLAKKHTDKQIEAYEKVLSNIAAYEISK